NVHTRDFPEAIKDRATSMYLEGGRVYSRAEVAAAVTDAFEEYYEVFVRNGDMSELRHTYEEACVNVDERVRVLDPKGEYDALAHGIDDRGRLKVIDGDGTEKTVYAGEVSVRGIYGYV
ncbi:MAG: biotin--[acetyl-CoA-carboxylase] ligase, partial [Lachnospiraceae bacterium]|nr:biotin--[acetyl-CoA-carboxylase] ligase [Lachnospiraceae bacterium]